MSAASFKSLISILNLGLNYFLQEVDYLICSDACFFFFLDNEAKFCLKENKNFLDGFYRRNIDY